MQELVLTIEIFRKKGFLLFAFRPPFLRTGINGLLERWQIEIDWNTVDMMNGTNDVLDPSLMFLQQLFEIVEIVKRDKFSLQSDQQSNSGRIKAFQAMGLIYEIGELLGENVQRDSFLRMLQAYELRIRDVAVEAHLLWVEILDPVPRDMFRETVDFETLTDGFKHDILQDARSVLAELARMRVMAVGHVSCLQQARKSRCSMAG